MIRGIPHTSACNAFTGDNHLFGTRIVGPTLKTSQHILTCLDRTFEKIIRVLPMLHSLAHGFSDNTSASDKERTSERFDNLLSFAIYLALRANKSGANYGAAKAEETAMETGVAEKHTGYGGGVETDTDSESRSESRPTIIDEVRSLVQNLRRLQGVKGGGFIDAVLRGLGQVVFQNNSLTGLLVLLAISVNSFVYAGAALFGAVVSTYTARLLRIDNRLVRDGLFGFNGALTAIAMVAFSSKEFAHGDLPSALLVLYVGLAAGFSTILARAFAFMVRNDRVPGLNFPYCVATMLLLSAAHQFSGLGAGTVGHALPLHPAAGTLVYASDTWLYGIGTGISQIFLQDNWLTGIVVVAAIAVSSPIAAAAVVAGSALAVAAGSFLGVSELFIRSGLLGYNAALTALALGGFFVLLDRAGAIYAALGVVVTACVSVGLAKVLAPSGLPVLTLPFVIVTWLMLLGAKGFPVLRTIPPEHAISPEDTLRRLAR